MNSLRSWQALLQTLGAAPPAPAGRRSRPSPGAGGSAQSPGPGASTARAAAAARSPARGSPQQLLAARLGELRSAAAGTAGRGGGGASPASGGRAAADGPASARRRQQGSPLSRRLFSDSPARGGGAAPLPRSPGAAALGGRPAGGLPPAPARAPAAGALPAALPAALPPPSPPQQQQQDQLTGVLGRMEELLEALKVQQQQAAVTTQRRPGVGGEGVLPPERTAAAAPDAPQAQAQQQLEEAALQALLAQQQALLQQALRRGAPASPAGAKPPPSPRERGAEAASAPGEPAVTCVAGAPGALLAGGQQAGDRGSSPLASRAQPTQAQLGSSSPGAVAGGGDAPAAATPCASPPRSPAIRLGGGRVRAVGAGSPQGSYAQRLHAQKRQAASQASSPVSSPKSAAGKLRRHWTLPARGGAAGMPGQPAPAAGERESSPEAAEGTAGSEAGAGSPTGDSPASSPATPTAAPGGAGQPPDECTPAAALPRVRTPGKAAAEAAADLATPLLANSAAAVLHVSEAWRDESTRTQARWRQLLDEWSAEELLPDGSAAARQASTDLCSSSEVLPAAIDGAAVAAAPAAYGALGADAAAVADGRAAGRQPPEEPREGAAAPTAGAPAAAALAAAQALAAQMALLERLLEAEQQAQQQPPGATAAPAAAECGAGAEGAQQAQAASPERAAAVHLACALSPDAGAPAGGAPAPSEAPGGGAAAPLPREASFERLLRGLQDVHDRLDALRRQPEAPPPGPGGGAAAGAAPAGTAPPGSRSPPRRPTAAPGASGLAPGEGSFAGLRARLQQSRAALAAIGTPGGGAAASPPAAAAGQTAVAAATPGSAVTPGDGSRDVSPLALPPSAWLCATPLQQYLQRSQARQAEALQGGQRQAQRRPSDGDGGPAGGGGRAGGGSLVAALADKWRAEAAARAAAGASPLAGGGGADGGATPAATLRAARTPATAAAPWPPQPGAAPSVQPLLFAMSPLHSTGGAAGSGGPASSAGGGRAAPGLSPLGALSPLLLSGGQAQPELPRQRRRWQQDAAGPAAAGPPPAALLQRWARDGSPTRQRQAATQAAAAALQREEEGRQAQEAQAAQDEPARSQARCRAAMQAAGAWPGEAAPRALPGRDASPPADQAGGLPPAGRGGAAAALAAAAAAAEAAAAALAVPPGDGRGSPTRALRAARLRQALGGGGTAPSWAQRDLLRVAPARAESPATPLSALSSTPRAADDAPGTWLGCSSAPRFIADQGGGSATGRRLAAATADLAGVRARLADRPLSPSTDAPRPQQPRHTSTMLLARALSRLPVLAALAPTSSRAIATTAPLRKASEPAFEHREDDDGCAFQTKIHEVLQVKKDECMWVSDECMVLDAVRRMAENNAGSLLVYDKDKAGPGGAIPTSVDACVGIITERDYLKKIVVKGLTSATTPVRAIMTPQEVMAVLTPNHTVLEAMQLMVQLNVRHVPVTDANAMAGVLSMKDVMKVLLEDQKHEIDSLKDYIHGTVW
ncbi:CBSX3 [Scenedesmus sp. PABB004]|nr:CBSX3 [Scenedesmus sp. PABB004]